MSQTHAQIPNPGFENWFGGDPVNWLTSNSPPTIVNVTQSNQSHSGSSAAQGVIIDIGGFAIPVLLSAGVDGVGFPINTRPAALRGWYKFTSVGGDMFTITSAFAKNGTAIGGGAFSTNVSTTTYREFVANTFWSTAETPDTAFIVVQVTPNGTYHAGSTFWIDDVAYGPAADVREEGAGIPKNFSLHQNYPNPFNPTTKIRYELPNASRVTLKVYNLIGQEVAALVDGERVAGVYAAELNAASLSSGTYFYRLQAGEFSQVKKLTVLK